MSEFRVVVLSSPEFANRRQLILNALKKQGVPVLALVLSSHTNSIARGVRIFWRRMRKYGLSFFFDDFLASRLSRSRVQYGRSNSNIPISKLCQNIIRLSSFKKESAAEIIAGLSPDLLILAGTHILPQRILSIPRLGAINSHLGLVPDFRGNYSVHWALYNKAPVGVTVHWVDAGIDTGPVIREAAILPGNIKSIGGWVQTAEEEAACLLASVVRDIVTHKIDPSDAIPQRLQEGCTYRYMPPKLQRQLLLRLNRLEDQREFGKPSKNVLITTQVFPPEIHPSAVMVEELAKYLSKSGWQVSVAAGYPHHPYGRLYPGYIKKVFSIEAQNGFRVIRGWHLISPSSSLISRALVMLSQAGAYFFAAEASLRPDVVISYGPALIGPLISLLIAQKNQARLLTLISDIYPDIAIEMGYLKNPALIRAARKFENLIYQRSDKLVVLSEGFRHAFVEGKGVPPEKVAVIPVWLDGRDIHPLKRDNLWRREMGIELEKFVVLYAGTIGLVSGAEVVVEAAKRLENYQDVQFLFVGAGYAKDRVEAKVNELGLKNVLFLPFQPRERLSELQAAADVSLVTLAPGRGKTSVPSKVLGYMAAARPVIAAVDEGCDTAELIRTSGCGLVVPPGRGGSLAEAILHFYENPKERLMRGEAGYRHFLQHFERKVVLKRYIETIQNVLKSS